MFNLPDYQFIFPDAPFPHPQVPGGKAWYALETENYTGIEESRETLFQWIVSLEATTGVPLERTILSGFSQGGAMALDVGLNFGLPLAGLCCLSGYLHFQPYKIDQPTPPILIAHGRQDLVVPVTAAQSAQRELKEIGIQVEYREFDMGHEITPPVLALMQRFILGLINC
jgi:phospholipase/carboxylesterase